MYKTALSGIGARLQTKVAPTHQIFDLLQFSLAERQAKEDFIRKMDDLRDWERYVAARSFEIPEKLIQLQTICLRKHARDAVKHYKNLKVSRIKLFKNYMEDLPVVGISKRLV
jgi:hypothetical protein